MYATSKSVIACVFYMTLFPAHLLAQDEIDTKEIIPLINKSYFEFGGEAFGKNYSTFVFRKAVDDSPDWNEDEENPPLSARRAESIATKAIDQLIKTPSDYSRELESLALKQTRRVSVDRWFWVATFQWLREGAGTGPTPTVKVIVLMDGTVMKPMAHKN